MSGTDRMEREAPRRTGRGTNDGRQMQHLCVADVRRHRQRPGYFQPIAEQPRPVEQQDLGKLDGPMRTRADYGQTAANRPRAAAPRLAASRPMTAGLGFSSSSASKAWGHDCSRSPFARARAIDTHPAALT